MKSRLIKLSALTLAVAMIISMAACQLKDTSGAGTGADNDASRDEIAVTIGGKYNITKGEITDAYNNMVAQYQYYGMSAPTAAADIESLQDSVVDMLVSEQMQLYQADQMGVTVDTTMRDQIDADTEDEMMELTQMFRSEAQSEGAADVEARTIEIFNEQLAYAGLDMDMEGYRAYIREQIEKEAIVNALTEKLKSEITVTDEEVQTYYDDLLTTQKEAYTADPSAYLEAAENFEKFGGDPVLVVPEGYVRVKTITISPKAELSADYTNLDAEMTKLEAEFGNLSLNDAAKNAKRIAEIRTDYAAKKTEADALYETYIADAREKTNKAYADLLAGKSFDEVLSEYGEDDVYTTYPIFAKEGLLMQTGVESAYWPKELADAVNKLSVGGVTPIVNVEDMFYIAQLVGPEQPGETAFEDVQEEMQRMTQEAKAEDAWSEQLDSWISDSKLVVRHEDVYRSIGK